MIILRKAKYEDKEGIIEITKDIWRGNDYIPNMFNKWVEDNEGEFTAVEIDGVVKGCAKFTVLSKGEYWLEGIRVAEDIRNQGIGKKVTKYYIDKAKKMGFDTLSLSTSIKNKESRNIVKINGFKKSVGFKMFYLEEKTDISNVKNYEKVKSIEDIKHIFDTKEMNVRKKFLSFGWTFMKSKQELMKELINKGSVYSLKVDENVVSTIILSDKHMKRNGVAISHIDGEGYYEDALKFAIKKYSESNYSRLLFMCPNIDFLKTKADEVGFRTHDDNKENVFVFEYM